MKRVYKSFMIKNLRHTGIVVNNLDKCLSFYLNLGFYEISREIETGSYIDNLVGLKDVKLECAKLALEENITLELLKYHSHPYINKDFPRLSNRVGCSHIALTVSNILECSDLIQLFILTTFISLVRIFIIIYLGFIVFGAGSLFKFLGLTKNIRQIYTSHNKHN